MMRRAIVAAALVALTLCGCGGNGIVRTSEDKTADERFICDEGQYSFETVVDSHTGVTYLIWRSGRGNYAKGGITVLLDQDGSPVISEEASR